MKPKLIYGKLSLLFLRHFWTLIEKSVFLFCSFAIKVGIAKTKGIHIREGNQKPREYSVNIEPIFLNDKDVEAKKKIEFNMRITLIPSENWVQCGSFLDLCYGSRTVAVKVDPTNLPIGVHSACVRAYDSRNIAKGILFEIPITVVVPIIIDTAKTKTVNFDTILYKPNTIVRHFIYVPTNATYAGKIYPFEMKKSFFFYNEI